MGKLEAQEKKEPVQIHKVGQKLKQNWNPGLLAPIQERQRDGQGGNRAHFLPSQPLVVASHLAVATWMITKPLMSGKWELTRSTCSCLGPLLEGVMLNWTEALSWGSRLGTLGKGDGRKADHQPLLLPNLACPLQSPWDQGHTLRLDI